MRSLWPTPATPGSEHCLLSIMELRPRRRSISRKLSVASGRRPIVSPSPVQAATRLAPEQPQPCRTTVRITSLTVPSNLLPMAHFLRSILFLPRSTKSTLPPFWLSAISKGWSSVPRRKSLASRGHQQPRSFLITARCRLKTSWEKSGRGTRLPSMF